MVAHNRYLLMEIREMLCRKMEPINIARSLAMPLDKVIALIRLANR